MALNNLLLQLQQNETNQRLQDAFDKESDRRSKAGSWSSKGNLLGGGLGLLGGAALGLTPAGWGLAGIGALAGAGSFLGGKLGQQWAGGREKQATSLGKNVDLYTGQKKEFSDRVKKRYRQDVSDFSKDMNNAILTKAVQTGIKSAAFAGQNPDMWTKGSNFVRGGLGLPTTAVGDAVTEGVTQAAASNVTPPVASTTPAVSPDAYIPPSSSAFTGPPAPTVPPAPQTGMEGLGPLNNASYDQATSNPFLPDYTSDIAGANFNPTLPVGQPTIADTASIASNTAFNPAVGSSTAVGTNLPIGNVDSSIINPMPTTVYPVNQNVVNAGARAEKYRQKGYKLPNTLFNMFQGN